MMEQKDNLEESQKSSKQKADEAFLTLQKEIAEKKQREKKRYNLNDMLFPMGKAAKLCRLRSNELKWLNFKEILIKLELQKP